MIDTKIKKKLSKEFASFLRKLSYKEIKEVTFENFFNNKMLIIKAIERGIPYSLFVSIKDFSPFSENDWAKFFDISPKSLHRYKTSAEHHFKLIHSEKIIEITEVTKLGLDVFGNIDKFKQWLNTPNFALGNSKPTDLLKDSYGKDLVLSELDRINHGILV